MEVDGAEAEVVTGSVTIDATAEVRRVAKEVEKGAAEVKTENVEVRTEKAANGEKELEARVEIGMEGLKVEIVAETGRDEGPKVEVRVRTEIEAKAKTGLNERLISVQSVRSVEPMFGKRPNLYLKYQRSKSKRLKIVIAQLLKLYLTR